MSAIIPSDSIGRLNSAGPGIRRAVVKDKFDDRTIVIYDYTGSNWFCLNIFREAVGLGKILGWRDIDRVCVL